MKPKQTVCPACWHSPGWCKCTRWEKLRAWPYWPFAITLALGVAVCLAMWHFSSKERVYSVPAHLCEAHRTGRTRDETVMQCQTNGKNACAYQIPTTTTYHEKEVTCRTFSVWE